MDNLIAQYETEAGEDYQALRKIIESRLPSTYCQVQWKQPYYKCVRRFLSDTIPELLRLESPEKVRIVFWFDN
jgi:hypothetical protein